MDFSHNKLSQSLLTKFTLKRKYTLQVAYTCAKRFPFYVGHMAVVQTLANLQGKNETQNRKIATANNNFPLRLAANKTYQIRKKGN